MKRCIISVVALALLSAFFLWRRENIVVQPAQTNQVFATPHRASPPAAAPQTNQLGDALTDARAPLFLTKVLPKTREFFSKLDRLGLNPLPNEIQPDSCSKIRTIKIPGGLICPFVIGDSWTAEYMEGSSFSGITHFGQRGADNPFRAISHADADALRRLSQSAVAMPETEVWKIASRVADAFGIDPAKFEKPRMYEEGLFEYCLGIYTVEYRKKGSDPINQMNYTRSVSLKATSPSSAVLVSYSHLEATLR